MRRARKPYPVGAGWTKVDSEDTHLVALARCRGSYQRDVALGYQAISGSSLRGKAKDYAGKYKSSRAALVDRLKRVLDVSVETADHGRKVLVLTARGGRS